MLTRERKRHSEFMVNGRIRRDGEIEGFLRREMGVKCREGEE